MAAEEMTLPPRSAGADHRLENWLFPSWDGWRHSLVLYLYYLAVVISLLMIYGWGDFTTAPFVYQGF